MLFKNYCIWEKYSVDCIGFLLVINNPYFFMGRSLPMLTRLMQVESLAGLDWRIVLKGSYALRL
jgi:hypothetical protein